VEDNFSSSASATNGVPALVKICIATTHQENVLSQMSQLKVPTAVATLQVETVAKIRIMFRMKKTARL